MEPGAGTTFPPKIKALRLASLGVLAILAATAQAQSIHDIFGTKEFHRAYFAADTREVTFDGFQELDWEAKARAALPWLNLDHPTPPQVARLSTFESAGPQFRLIDFRAPLDAEVSRAPYLLIHADGIAPIRPVQLKGTISFDFNASMTVVLRKVTSGVVVGEPLHSVTSAAFVMIGKPAGVGDVRPGARFKKRAQAAPAVYDFTEDNHTVTWTTTSKEQPEPASALSFRLADRRFLLVRWSADFCESSYTLFAVGAALRPIAGNDYDCDP